MDLFAYSQIEDLEEILKDLDIKIMRLRGLRLMKIEEPISAEHIARIIKVQKVDAVIQWLKQGSWSVWSSTKDDRVHPAFIYKNVLNEYSGKYRREIVDYDFSKVHGKARKVLKLKFKQIEKEVTENISMFNKYAGKDVLYVHARQGGGNRLWCKMDEVAKHPNYLGDVDDYWDSTYCDIYYDISGVDLEKYRKEEEE